MQITVVGGTGLVGQGILKTLSQTPGYELYSLSRHGKRTNSVSGVTYHDGSFADKVWQDLIKSSDWVIDCVGILHEDPKRGQTYQNSIVEPAERIATIMQDQNNRLIFVSANYAPIFFSSYLNAKRYTEKLLVNYLGDRVIILYPGLIYDRERLSTYYLGKVLEKIPMLSKLRPIKRTDFAEEVKKIISHSKQSELQDRK